MYVAGLLELYAKLIDHTRDLILISHELLSLDVVEPKNWYNASHMQCISRPS